MESYEVSWQAPEFEHAERSANWYLWSMVAAACLIGIALLQKNLLFAVFILLAEIILISLGKHKPGIRLYSLQQEGLFVDGQPVRLFIEASGFAFFDIGGRYMELILHPAKKMHTYAKVLIPRERMEDAKQLLATKLRPFEYNGTVSDAMARWLKL